MKVIKPGRPLNKPVAELPCHTCNAILWVEKHDTTVHREMTNWGHVYSILSFVCPECSIRQHFSWLKVNWGLTREDAVGAGFTEDEINRGISLQ